MKKHYNITVYGRVQGVLFRNAARIEAKKLELHGFVKNLDDGSIYIEIEGDEKLVGDFIAWCRKGPKHAEIDKIEIVPHPVKNFSDFRLMGGTSTY